ncbi:MAG: plastocyanin/azurin family copper-binding protein [Gaiellaceae bacterium]
MRRISLLALAMLALAVGVAACGGDDSSTEPAAPSEPAAAEEPAGDGAATSEVALNALEDGSLAYDATSLETAAGEITIAFDNPSETPHNVAVEGEAIDTVEGEVVTVSGAPITLNLEPGTYTFFCSVPGHREAGMEGTLTVS